MTETTIHQAASSSALLPAIVTFVVAFAAAMVGVAEMFVAVVASVVGTVGRSATTSIIVVEVSLSFVAWACAQ